MITRNVTRLKQLGVNAARKDLDDAESQLASLAARRQVISSGLSDKLALTAPVNGVISARNVLAGQIVDPRETLFELLDPEKFWVEALLYDPTLVEKIKHAQALTETQQSLQLKLVGFAHQLREHAIPLQFQIQPPVPMLAALQPVKVFAQTEKNITAILVPDSAVLKTLQGEMQVWVHHRAEVFKPVSVQIQVLDGKRIAITSGLQAGDRVVSAGANLLAQVR
jgi:membrane-associated protease RseP (regulator of RpoE activity)